MNELSYFVKKARESGTRGGERASNYMDETKRDGIRQEKAEDRQIKREGGKNINTIHK